MPRVTVARRTALVVALATLGACAFTTEPATPPNLSLLFGAVPDSVRGEPPVVVDGNDIRFRGTMSTPCLGYAIGTEVARLSDGYMVTLRGKQQGEICLTAIGRFPYLGTLWDLPSGSTRIVVRHVIDDANWAADTVIDTRVVVP